jgi:hypothetical protein
LRNDRSASAVLVTVSLASECLPDVCCGARAWSLTVFCRRVLKVRGARSAVLLRLSSIRAARRVPAGLPAILPFDVRQRCIVGAFVR